ncbi:MAG: hypothetical protein PUD07_00985 [bacterium]|nr:hypothetical protein [bacterium]
MNGLLISNIIADIGEFFNKVIISLVGGIFKLVNFAYRIFLALAENNIFNQEDFSSITANIYKILSIVMLFILSYGILNKIVDPDSNKSAVDGKKIFTNFIISIILITLCPSIFQFAYGFQSAFLNSEIISGIFTGNTNEVDSIHYGGIYMSVNTFLPFFSPTGGDSNNVYGKTDIGVIRATGPNGSSHEFECSDEDGDEECSLERATNFALETGSFSVFRAFAKNIYEGEVDFDWFAALIVGGFLVYVMISFCFDMGIRVCKLAFYQIIAPIAIFCMVIPKMDDIFKKWLSNVGKTFMSSFTRVFIMNLGVYFISLISDFNLFANSTDTGNGFLNLLAKCFIILGVVAFMRQAPKLLSDLFGFGDGDMKLGIKDKLKAGGAFAAGAAIGGGVTALTRNAVNAFGNFKDANGGKAKAKALVKGIGSTVAGGTSGLTKGLWYAKGAGSGKDMKAAAGKAADQSVANRTKRESYKASNPGFMGTTKAHIKEQIQDIKDWAGISSNYDELKKEQEIYNQGIAFQKKLFDLAADNELVLAYEGQKKKAQEREIDESKYVEQEVNIKDITTGEIRKEKRFKAGDGKFYNTKNEAMAVDIQRKTADIKMYDNLIKLAKLKTVSEKLGTDLRYDAVAQEFEMFKKQHANIEVINKMGSINKLTAEQEKEIEKAFNNLSFETVKNAYDDLSKGDIKVNLMYNTDTFKKESGRVSEEISKKLQEEQAKKE